MVTWWSRRAARPAHGGGPTVGPPGSAVRRKRFFSNLFLDHLECSNKCPLIDTPFLNYRWLHHTTLRYVRRVQLGAYTWRKGLNSAKTGSKWAKNTCLRTPNGPGSLLEKRVFAPSLTHFCSRNSPFSRHFGMFHGPKRVTTGSKWAKNTCLSTPNDRGSLLEKHVFDPFLTLFCSQNDLGKLPCGNQVLSQKLTGGAPGRGRKFQGALPKQRILCPKRAFFGQKRPRNQIKTAKRRETVATVHVRLDCLVTKSRLLPSNSTICLRNGPKMTKNHPNVRRLCQTAPKLSPRTGRILGNVAQN